MKVCSFTLTVSLLAISSVSCTDRAAKLPDYGAVPPFQMVDSAGRLFDGNSLDSKTWVADFIYTNCPAECPMMSSKMHAIEKQVRGREDVRLVSFSVDPERDTPAALRKFAGRFGGANEQWIFLTGSRETVHRLAYTTFHVGDVVSRINHSTKLILVDKRRHIRGYYSTLGVDDTPALLADLKALSRSSF